MSKLFRISEEIFVSKIFIFQNFEDFEDFFNFQISKKAVILRFPSHGSFIIIEFPSGKFNLDFSFSTRQKFEERFYFSHNVVEEFSIIHFEIFSFFIISKFLVSIFFSKFLFYLFFHVLQVL